MNINQTTRLFSRLLCGSGLVLASLTASAQSSPINLNASAFALFTFDLSNVTIAVTDGGQAGIYTGALPWHVHANCFWQVNFNNPFTNISNSWGSPGSAIDQAGHLNNAATQVIPWTANFIPSVGNPGITTGTVLVQVGDNTHPLTLDTPVQTIVRRVTVTVAPS